MSDPLRTPSNLPRPPFAPLPYEVAPPGATAGRLPIWLQPPVTLDVLRMAALRGDLNDLSEKVLANFADVNANPIYLYMFAIALGKLGFDFGPAHRALECLHRQRCSRCHRWYLESENGWFACVVPHAAPELTHVPSDDGIPFEARFYPCCGLHEVIAPWSPPPSKTCFIGAHTPSPLPVEMTRLAQEWMHLDRIRAGQFVNPFKPGPAPPRWDSPCALTDAASSPFGLYDPPQPADVPDTDASLHPTPDADEPPEWRNSSLYHPQGWVPTRLPGGR